MRAASLVLALVVSMFASASFAQDVQRVASVPSELISGAELHMGYVAANQTQSFTRETLFQPETWMRREAPSINSAELSAYVANGYMDTEARKADVQKQRRCLAQAIYHEARGEPEEGQWAVADVILNRVTSARYPSSVCEVVFQNANRSHGCQFSFACNGRSLEAGDGNRITRESWVRSNMIALSAYDQFLKGQLEGPVPDGTLYFHTTSVSPSWASVYKRVATIGNHVFYAAR